MKRRTFLNYGVRATVPFLLPDLFSPLKGVAAKPVARKLIMVHLKGGNDGYNTIIPFSDPQYYLSRPTLAIPKNELIRLDRHYALNPALQPLHRYFKQGNMLIINQVALKEMEHSHHTAIKLWETGSATARSSWIARYWQQHMPNQKELSANIDCLPDDFVTSMQQLADKVTKDPNQNIYSISLDGFDTHQFQKHKHNLLLNTYALGMHELLTTLEKYGTLANTLIVTWSEFGRTWKENTKKGTDHCNANTVLLFSGALKKKGILKTGGLKGTINTNQINSNIAQDWLQSSKPMFDDQYPSLHFI